MPYQKSDPEHLLTLICRYLDHNLLTELDNTTLLGVQNIENIDLSYNKISKIGLGTFANLSSINSIYLNNNELTELENSTF